MTTKKQTSQEEILLQKDKMEKEKELQKQEALKPKLPNHMSKNHKLQKKVLALFDIVPYSVVVEELVVKNDESTMKITLLEDDIYIKDMQPKLLQEYKFSSIEFEESTAKAALKATIHNSEYLEQASSAKEVLPEYINNGFLPKQRVEEIMSSVLGEKAVFVFASDFKSEITTYNYEVSATYKEPKEFFALIEKLNEQKYSMNISSPLIMKKVDDGILTTFTFQFHQNH